MFFISYSRTTDLARAVKLQQALRDLGVAENEIWFDRQTLEPGDVYTQRILDGIRTCRYFLPLVSRAATERPKAFVFREWDEATRQLPEMNRKYLLPLVVDADSQPETYNQPVGGGLARAQHQFRTCARRRSRRRDRQVPERPGARGTRPTRVMDDGKSGACTSTTTTRGRGWPPTTRPRSGSSTAATPDSAELLRLIRLSPFVTLYGKSGLGKSSMLQAGLFPQLRAERFLPVYLRLDYSEKAEQPPLAQAALRLRQEIDAAGADAPPPDDGESLWAYLQRRERPIWTPTTTR